MSLDYPNRSDWLARRNTPANLHRTRGRMFWHSPSQGTYFTRDCPQRHAQEINRRMRKLTRSERKRAA